MVTSHCVGYTNTMSNISCNVGKVCKIIRTVMKMNVCWHRLLHGQSVAITMETKSDPDQKSRPRSHLSEVNIFQQQHLTILIITHKLAALVLSGIINSFSHHAAASHYFKPENGCIFIRRNYTKHDLLRF